jgi:hypothetical protein
MAEPLDRYGVSAVFHGHAHRGAPEGRTAGGIPVYNVAMPVLKSAGAEPFPVKILELPIDEPPTQAASAPASPRATKTAR